MVVSDIIGERSILSYCIIFSHTHVFLVHVLVCCILGSSASLSNMPDDNEPGAKAHPKGGYTPGMFRAVKCVDDFAAVIRVPRKAMDVVTPKHMMCISKECPFHAIENNGNHCPAHQRSWYQLENERGNKNQRHINLWKVKIQQSFIKQLEW